MKSMTCSALGGACDEVFQAETFEEISQLSMQHGKQMFAQNDQTHIKAMESMQILMQNGEIDAWMQQKRNEFNSL